MHMQELCIQCIDTGDAPVLSSYFAHTLSNIVR